MNSRFENLAQVFRKSRNELCAFNITEAKKILGRSDKEIEEGLKKLGMTIKGNLDLKALIREARKCIGKSTYERGATCERAPACFDCSGFCIHWYGLLGIWLPRLSIEQSYFYPGEEIKDPEAVRAMDLIFSKGRVNRRIGTMEIGHVGLCTGEGTVIHAANSEKNIIEEDLEAKIANEKFIGIKRIVLRPEDWVVISLPKPNLWIEYSDHILWRLYDEVFNKNKA